MHATQQLCCEPLIEVGVKSVKVWRKEAEEVAYDLSDNDDLQHFVAGVWRTIKEQGYLHITVSSEAIKENTQRVFSGSRLFFAQEHSWQDQFRLEDFNSLGKNTNVGYAGDEQPQLFSVRRENTIAFPWPVGCTQELAQTGHNFAILCWEDWRKSIMQLFDLMEALSIVILGCLAAGMDVEPAIFTDQLLEKDSLPPHTFGRSNLLINHFDYEKAPTRDVAILEAMGKIAMEEHVDRYNKGLVTVIPCSDVPALQVLDRQSGDWVDVEHEGAFEGVENHFVVFTGDMLDQATGGFYPPLCHRVPEKEWKTRVSLPFQLRARHDAVLPPPVVVPKLVPPIASIYRHPVRVEKFLDRPSAPCPRVQMLNAGLPQGE